MRSEEAELRDLTLMKRLLALFKRKSAKHMDVALTDKQHVELLNILDALGLITDPDVQWLIDLDKRRAERIAAISLDDTLTRLALSLDETSIDKLLSNYMKKIKEVRL